MTQTAVIVLLLKVFLISGFCSLAGWVGLYTWLTRGQAWRNPIGQTLVVKSLLVAVTFLAIALPAFVPWFARHPLVMGWTDVGLIGAVTPVMLWRSWIWVQLYRAGDLPADGGDGQVPGREAAGQED